MGEKETLESTLKFFEDRFERLSDLEFYQVRLPPWDIGTSHCRALAFTWQSVCKIVHGLAQRRQRLGMGTLTVRSCFLPTCWGWGTIIHRGLCRAVQERRLKRLGLLDDDGKSTYDGGPRYMSTSEA